MSHTFIEQLAAVGAQAPSADNCQPWTLHWTGRALEVAYASRHPDTNVFDADSHATLLAVGGVAENLSMALAANGVDGAWRWSGGASQPYGELAVSAPLPDTFVAPSGPARRHTNRLPYQSTALPADVLAHAGAAREGGNRTVVLTEPDARECLVQLVRQCAQARFCNQDLHRWLFGSLRHTPQEVAQGDGLDMNTLGLPPGGRAMLALMSSWKRMEALNRIGAYKLLAHTETQLLSAAPALVCVVGPEERYGTLDAGRLLTRVWTELNLAGVAVQPYYVVTDQVNRLFAGTLPAGFDPWIWIAQRDLARLLGLAEGEMLHMILRVGFPAREPVRSRRLPLAQLFTSAD
ncbi:hypothetical protein [Massilia horti]|uniref:Nitroreductase n=1 Tax=Massilia horti TaxID=2562153 RepID=A0A4Y9SYQ8_9BURK|nr:hypothetical protein [Massilia horti]TFW30697.1 hypothetical protein E4O92_16160 [Massilia horti]